MVNTVVVVVVVGVVEVIVVAAVVAIVVAVVVALLMRPKGNMRYFCYRQCFQNVVLAEVAAGL